MKNVIMMLVSAAAIFNSSALYAESTHFSKMAPCPKSPNCVSSLADPLDSEHYIPPFSFKGSRQTAYAELVSYLNSLNNVQIIEEGNFYIHAVFITKFFRFKDDVEFLFPKQGKKVEVKSASRVGYSDMGKNRKRIERIREAFNNRLNKIQ